MNISKSLIITSLFFFYTSLLFPRNAYSQEVITFAGSGSSGSANGTGTAATFNNPQGAVVDANGNVYIADKFNHSIRKITTSGVVSTFATGFSRPNGLAIDASGNIYVADEWNHKIKKVTSGGTVTTLAGSSLGMTNATGTSAQFNYPSGVAVDASGNVYVADKDNHRIRKITSAGVVTTFAGSGSSGNANGTGTAATFSNPTGLAIDANDNIYVTDYANHSIRKITSSSVVTTLAGPVGTTGTWGTTNGTGTSARFNYPYHVVIDSDENLYVSDYNNHKIRKITSSGVVTTYAGSGSAGSVNGTGTAATFDNPKGLAIDANDNIYVADFDNHIIRKITPPLQLGSDIDGEAASDEFGSAVAVSEDGSILAVGAAYNDGGGSSAGHVRVYQYASSSWSQLGGDIDGEAAGDRSGTSISLSDDGSIIAIGSRLNDGGGFNFGHVRVYQYASSSWSQLGSDIDGEAANDFSGQCVSLSGDGTIVAISATDNDGGGPNAGHVRVYQYASGSWSQLGNDIDGEAANDKSGSSISLSDDGTILAVGAFFNDGNGSSSGHVRVYQYASSSWSQLGSDIDGEASNDLSGYSVSLSDDGTILALGAYKNDGGGTDAGHVRVYKYASSSWTQLGSDIDGEAAGDWSGSAVSLSGDGTKLAVGAYKNGGGGTDAGHVRLYKYASSSWAQLGYDVDGESAGDQSGNSVALSGDGITLAIGAPKNDGAGTNAGSVRVHFVSAALPVELIHFTAQAAAHTTAGLTWATATEIDNSHFVVERSYNARSFAAIDRVEGNGNSNSNEVLHYNYTDTHIAKGTKLVYYRLHQFDYNGASEYSDVRIVHFDEAKNLEIAAYPNPFSKEVTLSANTNEEYSVVVTDINGVTLLNLENGDRSSHKLDLKSWASGIYYISVTSKQGTQHLKIVKK
ncbi:MAG: sugar lactone lactonase YvrE [Bacteroidia bacterium]|jgi:sugar lactone lactonase YvrE